MNPLNHGRTTPKIRPPKPVYRAFRRACPKPYADALAVLTGFFSLETERAETMVQGSTPTAVIFRSKILPPGLYGAVRLASGQWTPVVSDSAKVFKSPKDAEKYARTLCRIRGERYTPTEWVILEKYQPAAPTIH